MPWVIVIGAAIALCYVFPKFRKFVGSLVWLLVLLVGGYTLYSGYADYRSSKRISPDQVEITGLELRENRLTGRVRNNSPKYTLTSVSLKLTVRDVVEEGGTETVAETAETLLVDVPPGRSRHFEEPLFFSGLEKPRGRFQWDYRVTGTRGK